MRIAVALVLLFACACFVRSEQRPRITGIAQVRLFTANPDASVAFYSRTLGFDRTQSDGASHYAVNELQSIEVLPLPASAPQSRLAAVVFRTTNAAALERYLREHAIAIAQPLAHGSFGVRDPEGNLILFTDGPPDATHLSSRAAARRIIHAGFVVKSAADEDRFYRDILGFHLNWQGGHADGSPLDWISLQVPDGTDWLEYMLNAPPNISDRQLGVSNHFSLGTAQMNDVIQALHRNGCSGPECDAGKFGRDGKIQLNLFDPDQTRTEFMEFKPTKTPCCTPILGKAPSEKEDR